MCGKSALQANIKVIADLFAAGKVERAKVHRLGICCHASECGLLCPNMEKDAGRVPSCCPTGTVAHTDLYAAAKISEKHCPEGRW